MSTRVKLIVVFYHPKDERNVRDIEGLAAEAGGELVVVPRPGGPCGGRCLELEEAARLIEDCWRVLLETYGDQLLYSNSVWRCRDCVAIILGAEDYGVPLEAASKLKPDAVARIPVAVEGMSYNVSATAAMAIYEFKRRCLSSRSSSQPSAPSVKQDAIHANRH